MKLFNLGVRRHLAGEFIKLVFSLRIPSIIVMLGHLNPSFKMSMIGYSFIHFYPGKFVTFSLFSQKIAFLKLASKLSPVLTQNKKINFYSEDTSNF